MRFLTIKDVALFSLAILYINILPNSVENLLILNDAEFSYQIKLMFVAIGILSATFFAVNFYFDFNEKNDLKKTLSIKNTKLVVFAKCFFNISYILSFLGIILSYFCLYVISDTIVFQYFILQVFDSVYTMVLFIISTAICVRFLRFFDLIIDRESAFKKWRFNQD